MVEEQQQDEDGHDEDGGGHGCQGSGEEENEPVAEGASPLRPPGVTAKNSSEKTQRSRFHLLPVPGTQKALLCPAFLTPNETGDKAQRRRGSAPSRTAAAGTGPRGDRAPGALPPGTRGSHPAHARLGGTQPGTTIPFPPGDPEQQRGPQRPLPPNHPPGWQRRRLIPPPLATHSPR